MLQSTSSFSDDIIDQRIFLENLGKKLNIYNMERWYTVTHPMLMKHGGSELLFKYNDSLINLLKAVYPKYPY